MFSPALAASLALASLVAGAAAAAPGDLIYARPGMLVATEDGAKLNLYCMGKGSPAVVFDSGWEDWAPAWAIVQPRVAKFTRACAYDRGGAGFSEPGPTPRTSSRFGASPWTTNPAIKVCSPGATKPRVAMLPIRPLNT